MILKQLDVYHFLGVEYTDSWIFETITVSIIAHIE